MRICLSLAFIALVACALPDKEAYNEVLTSSPSYIVPFDDTATEEATGLTESDVGLASEATFLGAKVGVPYFRKTIAKLEKKHPALKKAIDSKAGQQTMAVFNLKILKWIKKGGKKLLLKKLKGLRKLGTTGMRNKLLKWDKKAAERFKPKKTALGADLVQTGYFWFIPAIIKAVVVIAKVVVKVVVKKVIKWVVKKGVKTLFKKGLKWASRKAKKCLKSCAKASLKQGAKNLARVSGEEWLRRGEELVQTQAGWRRRRRRRRRRRHRRYRRHRRRHRRYRRHRRRRHRRVKTRIKIKNVTRNIPQACLSSCSPFGGGKKRRRHRHRRNRHRHRRNRHRHRRNRHRHRRKRSNRRRRKRRRRNRRRRNRRRSSGFQASFWRGIHGLHNVGQAQSRTRRRPSRTFTVPTINFRSTGGHFRGLNHHYRDNFVAKFEGTVKVPRTGRYDFWTNSDDGSKLWVNGRQVVNNDGLHGMQWRHGRIDLRGGTCARIKVVMFERGGGAGVLADWSGPGVQRQRIRATGC